MTAVLLALLSAALFGGMTVTLRLGLVDVDTGAAVVAMVLVAFAVTAIGAGVRGEVHGAWPFLLAGLLAPGGSQILFTLGVREVGASRTSVTVGAGPLVAVAIAIVFLHEPLRPALLVGAVAVVAGGALLALERRRPEHLRALGLVYAALATLLFATRDNLVRDLHAQSTPETEAAATLLAGAVVALCWARRLPRTRDLWRLAPAGVCFGLSYLCLFEAYYRGRVTVVSPLVGTESLWGVGLSALAFRRAEGVGRRLAVGAALVVAGGAIIGVTR